MRNPNILSDYLSEKYHNIKSLSKSELLDISKNIKHSLYENDIASYEKYDIELTIEDFNKLISPLITKTVDIVNEAITDSTLKHSDIEYCYLAEYGKLVTLKN